jgi:LPXTG-site transpeptidase (sortase) family protein
MSSKKVRLPNVNLRLFNNLLTIVVAILALYIITAPFLPQFGWWLRHDSPVKAVVPHKESPAAAPAAEQVVAEDRLFIPALEMNELLYGGGKGSLSKGVWRVPHTSTPDKGGNTVLVGHRFTYKDPTGVFYHLDKVQVGDPITVHWQGKVYEYAVSETKVVPATELSVEDSTEEPQLTLYTCTPLWSVTHRLVIIAKPVEVTP